ncbi:MAG: ABC transporter ATP-binding protein, partial [Oscillospiraceae bacterium]|nr:ABC transporter ATP-binding protein [Oscillospiraceae bacterium]
MLRLKNIIKTYAAGGSAVEALRGVDLAFRRSEFVAVLGPSGCGKTTLLNIIGGLDRYTKGDLEINGISTTKYRDADWDIYRNRSVGFVFQTYNLIPHQSVLANVELAMTLAGVSKAERRRRAVEALTKVGLSDQLKKKPTQMSGGQMQRVAIARALVNNPEIILADEPTGALDSETSVQIMEILKEIAKDRLIIMVTHNGELATRYASRTVRLLDGRVIDDSNPYDGMEAQAAKKGKRKKISMSFFTALSLSLNNLFTKKGRTFLTAFAGSIGIIGIALILSLSSGMQGYIDNMEADTLSTYPLTLASSTLDMSALAEQMEDAPADEAEAPREANRIYTNKVAARMMQMLTAQETHNDLARFKAYLESEAGATIREMTNAIEYGYDLSIHVYAPETAAGIYRVNPATSSNGMSSDMVSSSGLMSAMMSTGGLTMGTGGTWSQMIDNRELLERQYDVLAGHWPENYDEVMLVVNRRGELMDVTLYALGLLDPSVLEALQREMMTGDGLTEEEIAAMEGNEPDSFTYEELLAADFKLVLQTDYYQKNESGIWQDMREDDAFMQDLMVRAPSLKVVGIIRPNENITATAITGSVAYTPELQAYVAEEILGSEIVQEQEADPARNVLTGLPFDLMDGELTMDDVNAMIAMLPEGQRAQVQAMMGMLSEERILTLFAQQMAQYDNGATYDSNLAQFGVIDPESPASISIYPKDYAAKEAIQAAIADYNALQAEAGTPEYVIRYTDIMGLMMSSVTNIVNVVT